MPMGQYMHFWPFVIGKIITLGKVHKPMSIPLIGGKSNKPIL